ncbi:Microtubule bundling protein, partial [Elasticomyces elasticus]
STSIQSFKSTSTYASQPAVPPHDYSRSAQTMGPPRAPPPKMRNLMETMATPQLMQVYNSADRPGSVLSHNDTQMSSRFVRPTSPEDVYNDNPERMSYMSASMIGRNPLYTQQADFHSSVHANSARPPSRQASNTSSNLTTGTTVTNSENWETFSDTSEAEPDRHIQDMYHAKLKRPGAQFSHMAPPAKMRMQERIDETDENTVRVGSNNSWVDEASETY